MTKLYEKPRIWRTAMSVEGIDGILNVDTIEYLEYFWLVPQWLESPAEGLKTPARLIWLKPLPHQETIGGRFGDFVLSSPLPRDVWEGTRQGGWFVVVEHPDIWFEIPRGLH